MGVTDLWSILDPVRECVSLYSLAGKTLAVDLSLWVCEAQHVQAMMGKVTKPHLRNLFFRVSSLTLMGVKLVFVMEGDAPKIKAETMSKRTEARYGGMKAAASVRTTSRSRFKAVLRECAEMLDCLGVPWVTAAGEAEAMCAYLDSCGLVDGCITNDGDAFLYGARTVYRNFNMNTKDPQVDCYQMSRVQAELALTRETLVGLAALLGCDYIPKGVSGVGKEQTLKLIQSLQGQNLLQKFAEWRSKEPQTSEIMVKKVTHCLVCRHPGSAKLHERRGCVLCGSERFCSPQDYDSQCPCEWHRSDRQTSAAETNIRRKVLACERFPFTDIIQEFLVTKDKPVQSFRRRKPNLLLLQNFALDKMDWPKHYTSEKVLVLMTYTELVSRRHGKDSQSSAQIQPLRIHKPRIRNGVSCLEVVWKKPEGFVCAEGCEEQTEVRTVEEESIFSLAFPGMIQDFHRQRAEAQESKVHKKKPKPKKEKASDSNDAVSELFAQMSLQTTAVLKLSPPGCSDTPLSPCPAHDPASVSSLIGQLHLSSIDWESSSFAASPSQQFPSTQKDPEPSGGCSDSVVNPLVAPFSDGNTGHNLKVQILVNKSEGSKAPNKVLEKLSGQPTSGSYTDYVIVSTNVSLQPKKIETSLNPKPRVKSSVCVSRNSDDSDVENKPTFRNPPSCQNLRHKARPPKPITILPDPPTGQKPLSGDLRSSRPSQTPEEQQCAVLSCSPVHDGKRADSDSDSDSVDSPPPLAHRLKLRFAQCM